MATSYVAIFTATAFEFALIKKKLTNKRRIQSDDVLCFEGMFNDHNVLLVKTGVGLINAKHAFDRVVDGNYSISLVINLGIAGALNPAYSVGSVVFIDTVINENNQATLTVNQADSLITFDVTSIIKSTIISVNKPVFSTTRKHHYRTSYNADVVDMEAAAIIECTLDKKIPCCVIKGISDYADESTNMIEGIVDNSGKLLLLKTTVRFLRRPIRFIKGCVQMFRSSKLAMTNAIDAMKRMLSPSANQFSI